MVLLTKGLWLFLCGSFLTAFVMSVDGVVFDEQDFYSKYSKSEWVKSSQKQKSRILVDYIKRESAALDALERGLLYDPLISRDLENRKNQLLVNFVYDYSVAFPLISKKTLDLATINLKKDVFLRHILIAHSESILSSPPSISKEDALFFIESLKDSVFSAPENFNFFASQHSHDPGAKRNGGVLGWLQWGVTPMPFQSMVWSLSPGEVSNIIETDYGFHLVAVDSVRSSEFAEYDTSSYEYAALRSSLVSVRDLLKDASFAYDREVLDERVLFYWSEVEALFFLIRDEKEALSLSGQTFSLSRFVSSLDSRFVFCRVDGKEYGVRWFLSSLSQVPNSKIPNFNSSEDLVDFFKMLIMQKIAVKDGLKMDLPEKVFFKKRLGVERSKILYDALLKSLVNSVSPPDTSVVLDYYDNNKHEKYYDPEMVVVRQIKVNSKSLADSLYRVAVDNPFSFESLAATFSINRASEGGLMEPFERGKYNYMGEAAFNLVVGEISPPIENLDRSFSVILLEDRIEKNIIPLDRVYKRIESLLIKGFQEKIKEETFNGYINSPSLVLGEKYEKYIN